MNRQAKQALAPESLFESAYPNINLPPLWQVLYQEGVRGHHLLFAPADVELFDRELNDDVTHDSWLDQSLTPALEDVVVQLASAADLQGMVRIVDSLAQPTRKLLYCLYRRLLWTWRHYVRDQLN